MRLKFKTANWLAFLVTAIAIGAIFMAKHWSWKMALFPLTIGAALLAFTAGEFILSLLIEERDTGNQRVDFELSGNIEHGLRIRRTITVFAWIIGFFFLILIAGFMVSVPLFIFFCLRFLGRESWALSFSLSLISWGFVYLLFDRLLHIPFPQPWILKIY